MEAQSRDIVRFQYCQDIWVGWKFYLSLSPIVKALLGRSVDEMVGVVSFEETWHIFTQVTFSTPLTLYSHPWENKPFLKLIYR